MINNFRSNQSKPASEQVASATNQEVVGSRLSVVHAACDNGERALLYRYPELSEPVPVVTELPAQPVVSEAPESVTTAPVSNDGDMGADARRAIAEIHGAMVNPNAAQEAEEQYGKSA